MIRDSENFILKSRLDESDGEIHCENCLHKIDKIKDLIVTGLIVYICPACGEALDEYGWCWE